MTEPENKTGAAAAAADLRLPTKTATESATTKRDGPCVLRTASVLRTGIAGEWAGKTDRKANGIMRSEAEVNRAVDLYADTVRRICMVRLKSYDDTEDIFQTVFLKYLLSSAVFESKEHEKAWFIRVTINACKDLLKSFFHKRTVSLDEAFPINAELTEDHREVLEAVLELPEKYKDVIYLHYYEGYTAVEISKLLNKNVNTVYTLLNRAKGLLRKVLGGDDIE